ncbi:glycosyltransferase family 2 protein, partial [Vibrio vulnificus]|nr:glycosyltransferase family 2 protein [Vibrio vulnificus]
MSKKISVLMCVYNGEKYLSESINSVLNQTYENLEFVICNDGSNDSTREIIDMYAKNDRRIKVIHKENTGLTKSLIYALDFCSGEWIARQDADDVSVSNRLEKQLMFCEKNNLELSTTYASDMSGRVINSAVPVDIAFEPRILQFGNIHVHGSFFFAKEILNRVGYDHSCRVAQDFDFILQCISKKVKCGVMNEVLYKLRLHEDSISKNNSAEQITTAKKSL